MNTRRMVAAAMALAVAVVSVCLSASAADAPSVVWDANGSGGWQSANQWKDGTSGEHRLPTSSDICHIGTTVSLTATDVEFANGLDTIYLDAGATLKLVFAQDVIFRFKLAGHASSYVEWDNDCSAKWPDQKTQYHTYRGTIKVTKGVFTLPVGEIYYSSGKNWPVLEVWQPGVIEVGMAASPYETEVRGLVGDGVVSNIVTTATAHFYVACDAAEPCQFSGKFYLQRFHLGGTGPSIKDIHSRQDITAELGGTPGAVFIKNGTLGLKWFGGDGVHGSLGLKPGLFRFQAAGPGTEAGVRYLGTAGEAVGSGFQLVNENTSSGSTMFIDGGANGGLVFTNTWETSGGKFAKGTAYRVELRGDHANPCVVSNEFADGIATNGTMFVKKGSGTWRFANHKSRRNKGPILVEQGTLEYTSIAPAGTVCSLGLASMLSTNTVSRAEPCTVPWAYQLGDGRTDDAADDLATFAYVGDGAAACTDRPIAIYGAGRVTATGAGSVNFAGVISSGAELTNSLVLSGAGTNTYSAVTNGTGVLRVVKEGSGTWKIHSPTDIGGGIRVKEGTLQFEAAYTWYRFYCRETWGSKVWNLNGFGMWDAEGKPQDTNLAYNVSADANSKLLAPGEMAMTVSNPSWVNNRTFKTSFSYNGNEYGDVQGLGTITAPYNPVVNNESTWVGFVLRLPEAFSPVTTYDIRSWGCDYTASSSGQREVKSWSLEGSVDGVNWDLLHLVVTNPAPCTVDKTWYQSHAEHHGGYAIPSCSTNTAFAAIPSIAVDAGATLATDVPVTVNGLEYVDGEGCGTIRGFTFGEEGVIAVTTDGDRSIPTSFKYTFVNCEGLSNVANWTVAVNGRTRRIAVSVGEDGTITLTPSGMVLIVR